MSLVFIVSDERSFRNAASIVLASVI